MEQLTGHERKSSDLITLIAKGVAVSDVLIDSGATCNMVGQQTWEMLKLKGINCESHKYGGYRTVTDSQNFYCKCIADWLQQWL